MFSLNCARTNIKVWWSWNFGNCERILLRAKRVYSWNTWRWVERRRGTKFSLARNHLKEHLNYCWNIFWSLTLIWKYSIMFVFSLGCCCQEEAVSDHGREESIWYIYYQSAEPDYFCNVYWRRILVYTMICLCWLFHQSQIFNLDLKILIRGNAVVNLLRPSYGSPIQTVGLDTWKCQVKMRMICLIMIYMICCVLCCSKQFGSICLCSGGRAEGWPSENKLMRV